MAEVLREGSLDGLHLPTEILEVVLSQLPLTHLLTTAAVVCRHWSTIILNPAFLPWKKLYHQFKAAPDSLISPLLLHPDQVKERVPVQELVFALSDRHAISDLECCLVNIIKMMGSTHRTPHSDPTIKVLQQHPLYSTAMATLTHFDSSLLSSPYNTWHIVTTIVLISQDMWQVDSLLRLLLHPGSVYTSCDVVEAFYCLATYLLYSHQEFKLPTRYHYIVYYALYLFENSWAGVLSDDPGTLKHSHGGQQSLTRFVSCTSTSRHTHEQMRIVNHDIQPDHVVKIVAFAGTGKTTTLLQFCKQRPHLKFLLVVYNKSVEENCSRFFPPNTRIRTAHALAFASVGRRFSAKRQMDGSLSASKIASFLEKREAAGNRYRRAALVKNAIERFLSSADDEPTLRHVPERSKEGEPLEDDFRLRVLLPDAEAVWSEMKKCSITQRIPMTQDGQLKLWQLYKPSLSQYDIIMVDEAQDMNAAMFDIFLHQPCAKVIVGDPYQQIYSFRGAVNALSQVPATHTFHLTQSFRFGPEIGYAAHCVLEELLNVQSHTLVGGRCHDSTIAAPDPHKYPVYLEEARQLLSQSNNMQSQQAQGGASSQQSHGNASGKIIVQNKQNGGKCSSRQIVKRVYLARTNLELYKVALIICKDDSFKNSTIGFAGGLEKYGFDAVMDVFKVSQVEAGFGTAESLGISNKLIAKFSNINSLKQFAENLDDHDLRNKIRMYEHSGLNTPVHLNLLKKRCWHHQNIGQPDITFSTIHKAKGMEWDWVVLLDDLAPSPPSSAVPSGGIPRLARDEINLLYVAITRAKCFLTLNTSALNALTAAKEKFETLVLRSSIVVNGNKCLQCAMTFPPDSPHPLLTQVVSLKLSFGGDSFSGGHLCDTCAAFSKFMPPLTTRYTLLYHPRFLSDTSRVARRMLITGKKVEAGEDSENAMDAMERGWHNYANRMSRQLPGPQVMLDDEDFFDLNEEREEEQLEEGDIEEVIVLD